MEIRYHTSVNTINDIKELGLVYRIIRQILKENNTQNITTIYLKKRYLNYVKNKRFQERKSINCIHGPSDTNSKVMNKNLFW